MERTITVSDDVYKELLRMRSNRSFSEILGEMIWRKGNLKTLEIGFGTRDSKEKDILKTEIKNVEEECRESLTICLRSKMTCQPVHTLSILTLGGYVDGECEGEKGEKIITSYR